VPGGLGVLEAVVMAFSPDVSTFGALIVFRVAYFLIPLCLGATLFAGFEAYRRWARHADSPAFAMPQPRGGER
jgi:hypothetical protein